MPSAKSTSRTAAAGVHAGQRGYRGHRILRLEATDQDEASARSVLISPHRVGLEPSGGGRRTGRAESPGTVDHHCGSGGGIPALVSWERRTLDPVARTTPRFPAPPDHS
ncbi:MAG TPA: hypothetical protein VJ351_23090 [Streptosporangiaceae bacterium]|nr:hypothetical protein [Streptosporangiaceae bacterium]